MLIVLQAMAIVMVMVMLPPLHCCILSVSISINEDGICSMNAYEMDTV